MMSEENLIQLKKTVSQMSYEEKVERDLHLKQAALEKAEDKLTGFPSVDKPWLRYYSDEQIRMKPVRKTAFRFMYDENLQYQNDVAVIFLGKEIKYREVFGEIEKVAKALRTIGVNKGDIVTICTPNTPESAYLFYACSKIGAVADFIDPREGEEGLLKYLDISNPKTLVTMEICIPNFRNLIKRKGIRNIILVSPLESCSRFASMSMSIKAVITNRTALKQIHGIRKEWENIANVLDYSAFLKKGQAFLGETEEKYESDLPVAIAHTGGSTGVPKGVLLSNDNLNELTNQLINSDMPFKRHYLSFGIMPEFVGYGLSVGLHTAMVMGMRNMMFPRMERDKTPEMILKYKPNVLAGSPAHWEYFAKSLLNTKENIDLSFFKSPCEGGDTLSLSIEKNVNELLSTHGCDVRIQKGYGMTELCSAATVTFSNEVNPLGSVGVPLVRTNICICNEENEELGYNKVGEICIQSPTVMLEYCNNQAETDYAIRLHSDGEKWLHSGDLGYIDTDGFLYIVGRIKDIIIRYDGIKIYPFNVETQLQKNDIIKSVAIVGIKDPDHDNGEIPVAFITLNEGMESTNAVEMIKEYAESKVTRWYLPVDYVIVDSLPKTQVGKVDKKALRKMYSGSYKKD